MSMKWMRTALVVAMVAPLTAGQQAHGVVDCWPQTTTVKAASDGVRVSGMVSPSTVKTIFAQAYEKDGRFFGMGQADVKPTGEFEVFIYHATPTTDLTVKYRCE
jgi:hypothetical protein